MTANYVTLVLTKREAQAMYECIVTGEVDYNESLTSREWTKGAAAERGKRKLRKVLGK